MIKRPLHARFTSAVREGRKITTIRDKPWTVGKPVMLYNWSGAAYRSPQNDVAAVMVDSTTPIGVTRLKSGVMIYSYSTLGDERLVHLWACEGFDHSADMDAWFSALLEPATTVTKHLMRFSLVKPETEV